MPSGTSTVTGWADAIMLSAANALNMFVAAVPRVIGFLVILIIGWLIASALAAIVAGVLRSVRFDSMADRSGFTDFVRNMGIRKDAAGFVADATKWFVRLIVLMVAFDALGLPAVSQVIQQILFFIPNVIVALVVLIIGGLVANAFSRVVRGATAEAGFTNPDLLGTIARLAVWAFAILIALGQIGIASSLVNILFMGFVGAIALACGLAFGLGGRDTAGQIVRGWYLQGRHTTPEIVPSAEVRTPPLDIERPAA